MRVSISLFAVTAPIGAGHLHQLEGRTNLPRGCHVRATAQVEPVALVIDLQILLVRDRVDQLDLVGLALVAKHLPGLVAAPHFLGERLVALNDLAHLLLDHRQVFGGERLVALEVVEETVLDHGADGDLRARPQLLHGFRHHVRCIMPDQLQRFGIVAGNQPEVGILRDRVCKVGKLPVEHHRHSLLLQRLGDRAGHVKSARARFILAHGTIGKFKGDHRVTSCSLSAYERR
jgi:hypothetical protein